MRYCLLWEGQIDIRDLHDSMTTLTLAANMGELKEPAQYRVFIYNANNARTPHRAKEDAALNLKLGEVDGSVSVLIEV